MLLGIRKNNRILNRAFLVSFVLLVSALFLFACLAPVLAINTNDIPTTVQLSTTKTLKDAVGSIINIALSLVGIIFFGLFVYAGFLWMTAAGDPKKVETAKQVMTAAVIGLLIILMAWGISFWILSSLTGGGGGGFGRPTPTPGGYFSGGFGSGMGADSLYEVSPIPNSTHVPRNRPIVFTFKDNINVDARTVINDPNANTPGVFEGPLKDDSVIITNLTTGVQVPASQITVKKTADGKTFILKLNTPPPPNNLWGSATESQDYSVVLKSSIIMRMNGRQALREDFQPWNFQFDTTADLTPPTISSVIPGRNSIDNPRNTGVVINFSESLDPSTVPLTSGGNVTIRSGGTDVTGRFHLTNQYRTVEFITDGSCGAATRNSCGELAYCLPIGRIDVHVGDVADLSGNTFAAADGDWNFTTNGTIDITAPKIILVDPTPANVRNTPWNQAFSIQFDKSMSTYSFINNAGIDPVVRTLPDVTGPAIGYYFSWLTTTIGHDNDTFVITPGNYGASSQYKASINSNIRDITGNCFLNSFDSSATGCSMGGDGAVSADGKSCEILLHP